jgi:hypothetical protein
MAVHGERRASLWRRSLAGEPIAGPAAWWVETLIGFVDDGFDTLVFWPLDTEPGQVELPVGDWRARWSGFGEVAAEAVAHEQRRDDASRPDRYLLQLWPRGSRHGVVITRGQ